MRTPYEEFAILDAQIKTLTLAKDELKAQILKDMVYRGIEKQDTAIGNFTIATLKTWTYSNTVAQLEEDYKAQKATEEKNGDATFVEKPSLRFISIKL